MSAKLVIPAQVIEIPNAAEGVGPKNGEPVLYPNLNKALLTFTYENEAGERFPMKSFNLRSCYFVQASEKAPVKEAAVKASVTEAVKPTVRKTGRKVDFIEQKADGSPAAPVAEAPKAVDPAALANALKALPPEVLAMLLK